jgi:hypothetical protein
MKKNEKMKKKKKKKKWGLSSLCSAVISFIAYYALKKPAKETGSVSFKKVLNLTVSPRLMTKLCSPAFPSLNQDQEWHEEEKKEKKD